MMHNNNGSVKAKDEEGEANNKADASDSGAEKVKKQQQQQKVPFLKLFSFADSYDYFLMALGSVGACIHGASVPVFFIYFGKLINIIGLAYLFPKEASHKVAKARELTKYRSVFTPSFLVRNS